MIPTEHTPQDCMDGGCDVS